MQERAQFEYELRALGLHPSPLVEGERSEQEIIGTVDHRTPVPNTTLVPFRWICRIESKTQNGRSYGSGILIGPRHILTCAHVIYPLQNLYRTEEILVAPAQNSSDKPFGRYRANGWVVHPQWMRGRQADCSFDYGLIRLRENIANKNFARLQNRPLGHWGSASNGHQSQFRPAQQTLSGQIIRHAGYPGDKDTEARRMYSSRGPVIGSATLTECGANFQGTIFRTVRAEARMLVHEADTHEAQSGGPLWTYDSNTQERLLVGLHQGGIRLQEQMLVRLRQSGIRFQGSRANLAVRISDELINQVSTWIRTFVEGQIKAGGTAPVQ